MERENSIFIELINDMEKEIKELKKLYEKDKQYINEIEFVISKLRNLQIVLKPKDKILKTRVKEIDKLLNGIENIRCDVILTEVDTIYENIGRNLLDGMKFEKLENNNERLIIFENKEVGKINI